MSEFGGQRPPNLSGGQKMSEFGGQRPPNLRICVIKLATPPKLTLIVTENLLITERLAENFE